MIEREVIVTNIKGIHARPASLIVKSALQYASTIEFVKSGETVDAKSIMNIMTLAAEHGTKILIRASGHDEQIAIKSIINLFEANFGEDSKDYI